jgi:hypothetical protein
LRLWHDREAGEKYGGISAPAVAEPARITGGDYNALLTQYAIERFLYRLSKSELADHFILKVAMLFRVWSGTTTAPRRTSICLAAAIHHRTLWRTRFDTSSPFP